MDDALLRKFAAELAKETDTTAREGLMKKAQMLAMNAAPQEAFEPPIRTLADYLASTIEIPPVLIEPLMVVRGGINVTVGRAGKGKTVMNLNRALRWGAGLPLFDTWLNVDGEPQLAPSRPLKILIIENEGAAGMFHKQIGVMVNAGDEFLTSEQRKETLNNLLIWGDGGYSDLKFDDPRKLDPVRAGIDKHRPDIVFVEPFRSLWKGEENSATEMHVVVDAMVGIAAEYECAVMFSHHEKKGNGDGKQDKMDAARGSSVLEGIVTVMENFESIKNNDLREMSWSKSRHGAAPNAVRMEWVPGAWWYKHIPESSMNESIITALRRNADEPMTVSDIASEMDENDKRRIRDACRKLVDEGKIKEMASVSSGMGSTGKRYRLPNEDQQGGLSI